MDKKTQHEDLNEGIVERTKEELKSRGILEKISEFGDPFYMMISGAHNFGFPSVDSDIDVRGMYLAPTEKFLGLRKKPEEPTFEHMSEDGLIDVSIDEMGHYLSIVAQANGNRLEWLNSDLIIDPSERFQDFKCDVTEATLSKLLLKHYLHFSRDMWSGKTKAEGVKRDLYALRTYMVGTTIFEEGVVIPDIRKQNERFRYDFVDDMIQVKRGKEKGARKGYDQDKLARVIKKLDKRLISAAERSNLPDRPNRERINSLLVGLRKAS